MLIRSGVLAILVAAGVTSGTWASTFVTTGESETVEFFNVDSNSSDIVDPFDLTQSTLNPANTTLTATLSGGFDVAQISFEGTLQSDLPIEANNWTQNADIAIFGPGFVDLTQQDFVESAFTGYNAPNAGSFGEPEPYTGTADVGPLVVDVSNPTVADGLFTFYFFERPSPGETEDDNPGGTDQTWLDISITFLAGGVQDGMFDIGPLTGAGVMDAGPGQDGNAFHSNVVAGLDFFEFSVGDVSGDDYLNIQTIETDTNDVIDTVMFLFDSNGVLVAVDDDGQSVPDDVTLDGDATTLDDFSDTYSQLSFANDPLPMPVPNNFFGGDATSGEDGTLPAGDYTLVVGSFGTVALTDIGNPADPADDVVNVIGVSTIDELVPGFDNSIIGSGDYILQLTYGGGKLPGDYNADGVVDAADYTVWRDTFGSMSDLAADGDGSGTVDAADYDIWRQNFGAGAGGFVNNAEAVPEPTTATLIAAALVLIGMARSRYVTRV